MNSGQVMETPGENLREVGSFQEANCHPASTGRQCQMDIPLNFSKCCYHLVKPLYITNFTTPTKNPKNDHTL